MAVALNSMLGRIEDAFHERDATEQELRMTQLRLRRFVADASHELRSPVAAVSAVSAYAELFELGAKDRPEDLAKVIRGIRSESARMGRLVDELLLLARLDEDAPAAKVALDLGELVDDAVHAATAVAPEWPIAASDGVDTAVIGDAVRLRQVIDNLLLNVRTHTPVGTRTDVSVTHEGGSVVLRVVDHGPGIDAQHLAAVFERFFRADTSRSRASGGTGLGLAIVAAIVHNHGGQIDLSDTAGGGATFTIALPMARVEADRALVH